MPPVTTMGLGGGSQPDSITGIGLSGGKTNVIMFDQTKNPVYKLTEGLRSLHRKLKANWKVLSNQGDSGVTPDTLAQVYTHANLEYSIICHIKLVACPINY